MGTKKALIVTRVSGFVPQFEMNNVRLLKEMGYEVHYAANFDTVVYGTDNHRLDGTGIVCHHIPFGRSPFSPDVFKCYKKLKGLMLKESFGLVHCHMPMTGILARIAAEKVRRDMVRGAAKNERKAAVRGVAKNERKTAVRETAVIYTVHGFHFYKGAPFRNWIYYLPERWCARYTDCLITINEEDYARACSFNVRGRVEKISGVGINTDKEIISRKDREHIRRTLGVSEDESLLISIGELNANKNHIRILNVVSLLRNEKIKYVICGKGVLEGGLVEYIKNNNLGDKVQLLGYRADIVALLQAADIFVFPSLREGLSVSVLEAMAAGLPVIAKKIRGNTDLIEDGKGGYLVERDDTELYADAVKKLVSDDGLRRKMAEWNRERVKDFSVERVEEQMRGIYGKCLKTG